MGRVERKVAISFTSSFRDGSKRSKRDEFILQLFSELMMHLPPITQLRTTTQPVLKDKKRSNSERITASILT